MILDQIAHHHLCASFYLVWKVEAVVLPLYRAVSESFVKLFTLNTQGPEEYQSTCLRITENVSTSASGLNVTIHKKHYTKVSKCLKILSVTKQSLCSANFMTLQQ